MIGHNNVEKDKNNYGQDLNPDGTEKKEGTKNCCKKLLKFTFSHVGLCGMVVAYSIAGGFIFEHLEKHNEQVECIKSMETYNPAENETMFKLWEISQNVNDPEDTDVALKAYKTVLQKFRKQVLELGYNGKNCTAMGQEGGPGYQWSFSGALLFSVTVMTTIGYGNIAPKTFWGRLVCIAYATLGIPLTLLCVANIGDVMADVFRFVYSKVCCCGCCRRKDRTKVEQIQQQGRGNSTPEAWKTEYNKSKRAAAGTMPPPMMDDDDEDDNEYEKISVPLTVTMGVVAIYIFMGSLLFGVWESWSALKSSYFCFVTISTIGFGDVVPGSANFESDEDQYKMVLSAIYMLFGIAILSMCFSLVQGEIVAKFRWVGTKIGILEDEDKAAERAAEKEALEKEKEEKLMEKKTEHEIFKQREKGNPFLHQKK